MCHCHSSSNVKALVYRWLLAESLPVGTLSPEHRLFGRPWTPQLLAIPLLCCLASSPNTVLLPRTQTICSSLIVQAVSLL